LPTNDRLFKVKHHANGYVSNRVLKLNVGFLLADGPGHSHKTTFEVPAVRVSDDVDLSYIRGTARLSRTKEGILIQGELHVGVEDDCYRCLTPIQRDVTISLEELFANPPQPDSEFNLGDDGILDLAPLLRAESLIAIQERAVCQSDCKGLCPNCGVNLNEGICMCEVDDIDPRMAKLRELLENQNK
jgi:uncharacterized protein